MESVDNNFQEKSVDSSIQDKIVDTFIQDEGERPRCLVCAEGRSYYSRRLVKVAYIREKSKWKKIGIYCENCGNFQKL